MSSWQLVIKDLQGHAMKITVPNPQTATVIDLKRLITQHDSTMPVFEQRLVHERQELQDSSSLRCYLDIQDGTQIMLIRLIPFQIFVKGIDGSSNTYTVPSKTPQTFSVTNFKKLVQERTHLRPEEQRLQYAGKQLVDHMTLGDYNIPNNATLHLVSRLRGGVSRAFGGTKLGVCVVSCAYARTSDMPCGHAVSATGLYNHCMSAVHAGRDRVLCPTCSKEWSMKAVRQKRLLTEAQLQTVGDGLARNFCLSMPGVVTCVGCGSVWSDSAGGKSGNNTMCSLCAVSRHDSARETVRLLAECPIKSIDHAVDCPLLRACPKCGNVIEHETACRRVECNRCKALFCFICLLVRSASCAKYYPCPDKCATAARQMAIAKGN